ncbi:MAG: arsenical pump-driving ATPase [Deltaproteobacteria bacterium]|nr:arsenical pump-driving ATPase [Deltaproteobacteria bacterium]
MRLLARAPRHLFFTGKGGVGKTSVACASALTLAERGRRVLLVSTDPASNLGEVLGTRLGQAPTAIAGVAGLSALDIDPEAAARAYRERVLGPVRGLLPDAALRSIEEQLSGACTVEIAAFDEFSRLLGDDAATADFDHVVFDTAPTGHTLRLLALPAAWTGFITDNPGGTSCLGPLAGLAQQQSLYDATRRALVDPARTAVVLVTRAERSALLEAERTRGELAALGVTPQELVINGIFTAAGADDAIATAMAARCQRALDALPEGLRTLPRSDLPLLPFGLVGPEALRRLLSPLAPGPGPGPGPAPAPARPAPASAVVALPGLGDLLPELEAARHGVIMTVGKGGVGKTSVAVAVALELARRGHPVHLTTTDPAADLERVAAAGTGGGQPNLRLSRIDPVAETRAYRDEIMASTGAGLDAAGRALLEEDLRSPCTEEIAVFRAFARVIAEGQRGFVVIDTAPTGHTILLLDAAEAYPRDVLRTTSQVPDEVRSLLPRLRDAAFTRVLVVTLPEATPVHEAAQLQRDLVRAGITPFAWVINQSLAPLPISDPVLLQRQAAEARYHAEVRTLASRIALLPWRAG